MPRKCRDDIVVVEYHDGAFHLDPSFPSVPCPHLGLSARREVGGRQGEDIMRLLLIDDEPIIGVFIQRIAETSGFEVQATTEPNAFKEACAAFDPDVISLDLSVPDCDGIELLRYLAEIECRAQILIASGFDNKVLEAARDLGEARGLIMAGVVPKPIRPAELRAVLERVREASGRD